MRNLQDYNKETSKGIRGDDPQDFILSRKEWHNFESGTRAIRVKTYDENSDLVDVNYVLKDFESSSFHFYEVIDEMRIVSAGYMTDTASVTRK